MGLIGQILGAIFGNGRNVVVETAQVFRENAEAGAARAQNVQAQAMTQFGTEFAIARQGRFDHFMDGVNRLPRPALALGTLGLFVAAMVDPIWFASRMQGIALVPEPLWWLLGVIVSFYFGARHQLKSQDFQREIASTMARAPQVMANLSTLRDMASTSPGAADPGGDAAQALNAVEAEENPALAEWAARRNGRPATS